MCPHAPTADVDTQALLEQAARALGDQRPADALIPLRLLAMRRPEAAFIHHDLGLACLESGLLDEAVAALKRAVAIDPQYPEGHLHLGVVLERIGNTGAAVLAYHRATQLAPALTEAWYRAGALVHLLGHRDEAAGCFARAAEAGRKTPFGRLAAARVSLRLSGAHPTP
jgi:Flp pilus assembly protein TadD